MELRRASRALRQRMYLLLLGTIGLGVLVAIWSYRQPVVYSATSQIAVGVRASGYVTSDQIKYSTKFARWYGHNPPPSEAVERVSGLLPAMKTAQIVSETQIAAVNEQPMILVTVHDPDATNAISLANYMAQALATNYNRRANETSEASQQAFDSVLAQATILQTQIASLQQQLKAAQQSGAPTDAIQAQITSLQAQLSQLSGQLATATTHLTPPADFWVAQTATSATYLGANVALNTLLAAGAGLFASAGLALFIELLDGTIRSEEDILRLSGLTTLAHLPVAADVSPSMALTEPAHYFAVADAYRQLEQQLAFLDVAHTLQTLLFVPLDDQPENGLIGIYMAVTSSLAGRPTLLIDADSTHPSFAARATNPAGPNGFFPTLASLKHNPQVSFDAILPTDIRQLYLLPAGTLPLNVEDVLNPMLVGRLFQALAREFAQVIVLAPSVTNDASSVQLAEQVDGVCLLVRPQVASGETLSVAVRRLRQANAYLAGAVMLESGASGQPLATRAPKAAKTRSRRTAQADATTNVLTPMASRATNPVPPMAGVPEASSSRSARDIHHT